MRVKSAGLLLIISLLISFAGCGGGDPGSSEPVSPDPTDENPLVSQELLDNILAAGNDITSYNFTSTMTMSYVSVNFSGVVDVENINMNMNMSVDTSSGPVETKMYLITDDPQQTSQSITAHVQTETDGQLLAWMSEPISYSEWEAQDLYTRQIKILPLSEIRHSSSGEIDGIDCYVFDVLLDAAEYADFVIQHPGMDDSLEIVTTKDLQEIMSDMKMNLWVDKETNLLAKAQMQFRLTTEEGTMNADITMKIYGYNQPTDIALPTGWYSVAVDFPVGSYTSMAFDGNGNPGISYYYIDDPHLRYTHWDGSSWNIETIDSDRQTGIGNSLAFDSNNNPAISYGDGINRDLKYAYYNGETWNVEVVDSEEVTGDHTSLAFDGNDNPAISYYDYTEKAVKFAHYNGSSWDIQTIDSTSNGGFSSLAYNSSGNPCISYYHQSSKSIKYAQWTGSTWAIQTVDSCWGGAQLSLAFDISGNPAISYDAYNLKLARWDGSSWNTEIVDPAAHVGKDSVLAFDSNGNPAINYSDSHYTNKFAWFNGTSWDIEVVDSLGSTGRGVAFAFDASGTPCISYHSPPANDGEPNDILRYAYWNDGS